ncbi:MAG: MazG nucleotide pyrophosphohydrolase domain-containing protein [Candidatus Saccharimonadales bacterium]
MAGFVGDVGDLSKLIMAKNNLRSKDNVDEALAHELSDCLWSLLVLADKLGIDLDQAFIKTMDSLEQKLTQKL